MHRGLRTAPQVRACSSRGQEFLHSQYPTGRSFGKCTTIKLGSESRSVMDGRNTLTVRGRAFSASAKAELRPGECEAGLGRCTAPSQGAGWARQGRASVPMLLFLPSTLRSSSLGCPPTLAPPSTGSQLCSTLRFPCPPPLYRSQMLRGEGSYWLPGTVSGIQVRALGWVGNTQSVILHSTWVRRAPVEWARGFS